MSTASDTTLADPQQVIADLRRANDELRRTMDERTRERDARTQERDEALQERDEALQRETAIAEVLGVINSSPGELGPVFDAILERASGLSEAAFGILRTWDGKHFHFAAAYGNPRLTEWARNRPPIKPEDASPLGRIAAGEPLVTIFDASSDQTSPGFTAMAEVSGFRSGIAVALKKDSVLVGTLTVYRQDVRPFSDKQIALLQNFAAQAVIAMENARLLTETREALDQQTATAEVLQVINSSPGNLTPVFDAMLERATRLCEADFGTLWTFDGVRFRPAVGRGHGAAGPNTIPEGLRPAPGIPLGQLIAGKDVASVVDAATDPAFQSDPVTRSRITALGTRSAVAVALRKDGALFGAITANRKRVEPYSHKQIALLQNFAAQAVIAMENARLITETREALEQQTATAEVLGVINSSPGDLKPVFDAMLEKALRLCGGAFGILNGFDGQALNAVSMRGVPAAFAEFRAHHPATLGPGTPPARIMAGENVVHTLDLKDEEAYRRGDPNLRAIVDLGGARSHLAVAFRKDDSLLGMLTIYRQEVRAFSEKQIALLQNFAAQAVIAMENARLITETREALEQQTATAEVLGVINSSPGDLTPVFDAMLEKALASCGGTYGALLTFDGEHFHPMASRGHAEFDAWHRAHGPIQPAPGSQIARIIGGEDAVQITDIANDEVYREGSPPRRAMVDIGGFQTLLCVALRRDNTLLGVLQVYRQEVRAFTEKQVALVQNFAAQAVIAMENARLLTETREALEQQTATAEVLQVINSSPGDLVPVFDAMLEKATRLCEASHGILRTWDGERFHLAVVHGDARFKEWAQQRSPFVPEHAGGPLARLVQGEQVVPLTDALVDPAYQTSPGFREMVDASGLRSGIAVALRKDDALLGTLTVYRRELRPFSDKQIALLQNFAEQAVIAMENARLLGELRERNDEIAGWNRELETRVADQLAELERTGKLRRFLAPQLADLIIAQGDESILESHRREIVVVFCDIRGFTAFAERAEPEEVMALLRDYHAALGPIVARYEGTLDHYSGDGGMVFFNDPLPTPEPAKRAIEMAVAMREAAQQVLKTWRRHGHDLGFGVGISQGYATLGQIGFAERMDYTAIGTVCNLAARLCDEAKDGQILISRRVAVAVEEDAKLEEIGEVSLKGLSQAVAVYNVVQ
jgi:GAF domain-containing protein